MMNKFQSPVRGFSLIEALIALVLISVGVLGMVALQGRAIQYTQDSVQRNNAAMLANDLVEMIRAKAKPDEPPGLSGVWGFSKAAAAAFPTKPTTCTPMPAGASDQLACWAHDRVVTALPDAASLFTNEYHICRTDTAGTCNGNGDTVEIQLAWRVKSGECLDASATGDVTVCRYRLMTRIL